MSENYMEPIFEIKLAKKEKDYGLFIFEPLAQGFGATLGNSLRRVLLTSISGAAISRVKIKGVKHQFSTIPGLKEDVVELILNLRKINFRLEGEKEVKLRLAKKGPAEVRAKDIKTPASISIANKDEYLGSLAGKKPSLFMDIWVEQGRGYLPSEERKFSEIGVIPVDSFFNPVRRVNFRVEETRVGRVTNLDKLVFEVWTNGAIFPQEALEEGAKTLVSYFGHIYKPRKENLKKEAKSQAVPERILKTAIEELDLPVRVLNTLKKAGFTTIIDFRDKGKEDLKKVRNLGVKSIKLIESALKEKGVDF